MQHSDSHPKDFLISTPKSIGDERPQASHGLKQAKSCDLLCMYGVLHKHA